MGKPGEIIPRRGEVYFVNFDSSIGSEIQKTRPAVVLQNDIGNRYSRATIVAALTSDKGERLYPTEVRIHRGEAGLTVDSVVLLSQIHTIDKTRVHKKFGCLRPETMQQVDTALLVSLGLINDI